jgi:HAD superfamily hydrolase (TIGR01459 family)
MPVSRLPSPRLISGLSEIASGHDALICDVWGVIHDGARHHPAAAEALARFRRERGPVVLLTNAPRMPAEVAAQCASYGVPPDCYDAIVSSGGAARAELERRSIRHTVPLYYIGPDRDLPMVEGLSVERTDIAGAEVALAIGLVDDMTETPADYAGRLAAMRERNLVMLCANPDLVVHRGPRMVYCAGALAKAYEELGGPVIYYGKPHQPVYEAALAAVRQAAAASGRPAPASPLAVGDGLMTDVKGANGAGLAVLFIADGIHGEEVEPYAADHLGGLMGRYGVHADWAARALVW